MHALTSIRARLLLAYVGIILVGFAALTVLAGGQISAGARVDYGGRLQNEIGLIARGLSDAVQAYTENDDETALEAAFAPYEAQVNGNLIFYPVPPGAGLGGGPGRGPMRDDDFRGMLEIETASRGQVMLVERRGEDGEAYFYTAAPVSVDGRRLGIIQLVVPTQNLQTMVSGRWLELALICALLTLVAALAAFLLARSIIRPLSLLRESAHKLSAGDFSHRVAYARRDEIGEVAQAFNEMARQVESMLEEQRAFASNTSHELRTPLTTIRLRTEALRYDKTLDEATASQYITEIDDEMMRLGNLIQDLTLLSRFDAGRAELGQDQVDMLRFAGSVQHQVTAGAQDKQIKVALHLPEAEALPIRASIHHLTVVFRNLLDNAIKYTPAGGQVTWNLEQKTDGVYSIISDSGQGVDAEHLPHLFERFYRVDKARSRDVPGTGLGLALVKSIVEAYGGTINIESSGTDQGTTVRVFWPYQPLKPQNA